MKHWSSRYPFGSIYVFKSHVLSVRYIRHSSKSFFKILTHVSLQLHNEVVISIWQMRNLRHEVKEQAQIIQPWVTESGFEQSRVMPLAMCLVMVSYCVQEKSVTHVISDASSDVIQISEFGSQVQQDLRKSVTIRMNSSPKVQMKFRMNA